MKKHIKQSISKRVIIVALISLYTLVDAENNN